MYRIPVDDRAHVCALHSLVSTAIVDDGVQALDDAAAPRLRVHEEKSTSPTATTHCERCSALFDLSFFQCFLLMKQIPSGR